MSDKECCESGICLQGCKLESLVSIDDRGQIVLPKDLREKAKIKAGDKLAVVLCQDKEGNACCISLIKAEALTESIKKAFGPLLAELIKQG
jgi:antitoxin PrlF